MVKPKQQTHSSSENKSPVKPKMVVEENLMSDDASSNEVIDHAPVQTTGDQLTNDVKQTTAVDQHNTDTEKVENGNEAEKVEVTESKVSQETESNGSKVANEEVTVLDGSQDVTTNEAKVDSTQTSEKADHNAQLDDSVEVQAVIEVKDDSSPKKRSIDGDELTQSQQKKRKADEEVVE